MFESQEQSFALTLDTKKQDIRFSSYEEAMQYAIASSCLCFSIMLQARFGSEWKTIRLESSFWRTHRTNKLIFLQGAKKPKETKP